jgi:hypothetical protein
MDIYNIKPLAITQVEWREYIKFVEKVLGFNPAKGLSSTVIKLESPAAYLATLDFENRPLEQLRNGVLLNNTFDHLQVSFIAEFDSDTITELLQTLPRLDYIIKKGRKTFLVIISAKMSVWYQAVINGLQEHRSYEIRKIFQIILIWFDNLGFKDIWSTHQRRILDDGTFILQR